jgi:hypothetical protein
MFFKPYKIALNDEERAQLLAARHAVIAAKVAEERLLRGYVTRVIPQLSSGISEDAVWVSLSHSGDVILEIPALPQTPE